MAKFTGVRVDFTGVQFTGDEPVDFSGAVGWSHPSRFDWKGKPPVGVTPPAGIGDESQIALGSEKEGGHFK